MKTFNTVLVPRHRALALSTVIALTTLSGFTSVAAQAESITVEATVENCVISITDLSPIDLGDMPVLTDDFYEFDSPAALEVVWQAGMDVCAGSLYAERDDIVRGEDLIVGAQLLLDGSEVRTTAGDTGAEVSTTDFDVTMKIPLTAGSGTYSTELTFTVVVGP
jgi:hypothetical protein